MWVPQGVLQYVCPCPPMYLYRGVSCQSTSEGCVCACLHSVYMLYTYLCVCVDNCSFVCTPLTFVCVYMYACLCASYGPSPGVCPFCISVPGWIKIACLCLHTHTSMSICRWGNPHRCDCMDLHVCIYGSTPTFVLSASCHLL